MVSGNRLMAHALGVQGALAFLGGAWVLGAAMMGLAAYALRVLRILGR